MSRFVLFFTLRRGRFSKRDFSAMEPLFIPGENFTVRPSSGTTKSRKSVKSQTVKINKSDFSREREREIIERALVHAARKYLLHFRAIVINEIFSRVQNRNCINGLNRKRWKRKRERQTDREKERGKQRERGKEREKERERSAAALKEKLFYTENTFATPFPSC